MSWTAIWAALSMRWNMEKKLPYKVIVSDRARQMLAGHVRSGTKKFHNP